ncbi:MAG: agmatinase family protein [Phycisphaeraceae bacterium]|nr:MAG: agmatinase family protein [Phycisphaeraceae bacterium]
MPFDPNAAAVNPDAIFGLPHSRDDASIILIPVPYDATSSYGTGSAKGPGAIREASGQIDLFDRRFGNIFERGIHMEPHPVQVEDWSKQARLLSAPIIEQGGPREGDEDAVGQVDRFSSRATNHARDRARAAYDDGKTPGIIGGEHGVAFGLYKAASERYPGLGILQIDAHMDLRPAYEGFAWSHASVMHNVVHDLDGVARLVQVGIRDYCEQEATLAEERSPDRVKEGGTSISTFFWDDLADERFGGASWGVICERIITLLPSNIVISVDIDGLEPSLCPHTGTPVPGGLSWDQLSLLLKMIRESDRQVVGFDLVEVCPSPIEGASPIDAAVGARVLYRLCGTV